MISVLASASSPPVSLRRRLMALHFLCSFKYALPHRAQTLQPLPQTQFPVRGPFLLLMIRELVDVDQVVGALPLVVVAVSACGY